MQSPRKSLLLAAYGGLWRAASPFLRRHKRLRDGFAQRLVPDDWPGMPEPAAPSVRIWIQAASGGEAWLAHTLVPALAAEFSSRPSLAELPLNLLCTTCTRQGLEVLEKLNLPDAGAQLFPRFFPLDQPALMQKALRQAAPHLIVLLETEIWPGLLSAAKEAGVPVVILNGRMTEKSLRGYRLIRSFLRDAAPEGILAVSDEDARRFAEAFGHSERVGRMPNMKFDRVAAAPAQYAESLRDGLGIGEDCLLGVLASVREEEEDLLLPEIRALYGSEIEGRRLCLAVAPRHMHRVEAWKKKLQDAEIPIRLRSLGMAASGAEKTQPGVKKPVLLWDSFGELDSLYSMADAVFVGGSLAPLGGQNFLEPAAQGLAPLVGPYTDNFSWIGEELFAQGLAKRIGSEGLAAAMRQALAERLHSLDSHGQTSLPGGPALARRLAAEEGRGRFIAWLAPHQGGSARAAALLAEIYLRFYPALDNS